MSSRIKNSFIIDMAYIVWRVEPFLPCKLCVGAQISSNWLGDDTKTLLAVIAYPEYLRNYISVCNLYRLERSPQLAFSFILRDVVT